MRTIIAGSRSISNYDAVKRAIEKSGFKITQVLCGMAIGIDRIGLYWARDNHIPVRKYFARWASQGKRAGILRNEEMARNADALVAIWDGRSKGTQHMIEFARSLNLKVHVEIIRVNNETQNIRSTQFTE